MLDQEVPYQEALLLKKLGFNERCSKYYSCPVFQYTPELNPSTLDNPDCFNSLYPMGYMYGFVFASAATYNQAFDWLFVNHGMSAREKDLLNLQNLIFELKSRISP